MEKRSIKAHIYIINNKNYSNVPVVLWSRDSSVGIMTGYGVEGRSSIPDRGIFFLYSRT
jgi:hypothetical protein